MEERSIYTRNVETETTEGDVKPGLSKIKS